MFEISSQKAEFVLDITLQTLHFHIWNKRVLYIHRPHNGHKHSHMLILKLRVLWVCAVCMYINIKIHSLLVFTSWWYRITYILRLEIFEDFGISRRLAKLTSTKILSMTRSNGKLVAFAFEFTFVNIFLERFCEMCSPWNNYIIIMILCTAWLIAINLPL